MRYANQAIAKAMEVVATDVPEAKADPARPVYHFCPPAGFHNDPNGLIHHAGYFHMFYQHHPYSHGQGKGGPIFWGHARSRDLTSWEHLPFALWPSTEQGEEKCASGSTVIGPGGQSMIFYTSFGHGIPPSDAPEQWVALGDRELLVWRKHRANPILTSDVHDGVQISEWRDPFVFQHEHSYFMVIGGKVHRNSRSRAGVMLYRALNQDLTEWQFVNVLYEWPDAGTRSLECPNLFRFGDTWLLFFSYHPPPTRTAYLIGTFDTETYTFNPERQGSLDLSPMGVYAPQAMRDEKDRVILFGWVRPAGWYPDGGKSWCGCMTLPRTLSLDTNGQLRQEPVQELEGLRGRHYSWSDLSPGPTGQVLEGVGGDVLEIIVEFGPVVRGVCGLKVRRSADGKNAVTVGYDGKQIYFTGADPKGLFASTGGVSAGSDYHIAIQRVDSDSQFRLHLFIDKCVLELYVDRRFCMTRSVYCSPEDLGIEVFAPDGAQIRSLDIWEMKPA